MALNTKNNIYMYNNSNCLPKKTRFINRYKLFSVNFILKSFSLAPQFNTQLGFYTSVSARIDQKE